MFFAVRSWQSYSVSGFILLATLAGLSCGETAIDQGRDAPPQVPTKNEFQLTIISDTPTITIVGMIRNISPVSVTYNSWPIGYWECLALEVHEGDTWIRLPWYRTRLMVVSGIGPREKDNQIAQPNKLIPGGPLAEYPSARRSDMTFAGDTMLRARIKLIAPYNYWRFERTPRSFTLDLLAFDWPESLLQHDSVTIHVVQYGLDYPLESQPLELETETLRKVLHHPAAAIPSDE